MSVDRLDGEHRLVLVLAPRGRDAAVISQVLSPLGVRVNACQDLADLTAQLGDDAYVAIITEESLNEKAADALQAWIATQPPWSDFPFIILATKQAGRRSVKASAALAKLGNEVLLERPLNAETLTSAVNSAIRSRRRQYEARSQLLQHASIGAENRRLYEAERQARAEAEAANSAKDEFLAVLSHELRTPLSAILGWTYVLQQRRADLGDMARGVDTIQRNANSQARLIEDLLDMSRIAAGKVSLDVQTVVPAQLIDQIVSSLMPAAQAKNVTIQSDLAEAAMPIKGDSQRLMQVFRNLLGNALKFTPPGGNVRIKTASSGQQLDIEISDDGVGIDSAFLPHVFERFRQADGSTTRSQGGLGLGLAIVRSLVDMHGGSVSAFSRGLGQGATFTVRLPASHTDHIHNLAPLSGDSTGSGTTPEQRIQDVRILVVEDDADGREMVEQLLRDHGGQVSSVGSAVQALASLRHGKFDVVVSDIGMPELDGYELLRRIRAQGNPIPAIALTAFARVEDKTKAIESGFASHVSKPIEPSSLVAAVAGATRLGR